MAGDEAGFASGGRVRGVGVVAKAFGIPFGLVFLGCFLAWLFPPDGVSYGDPHQPLYLVVATFITVCAAFAGVRSLVIGVWLREDSVLVRSWFRTWRIPRADRASCRAVGYDGLLVRGGPSGYWSMLEFSWPGRSPWSARGAIARHSRVVRQAAKINAWLGAPPTAIPGGHPRHLGEPER